MATRQSTDLRTLLVGIDAASLSVLGPLFERDVAPTLRSVFEAGASGALESQIPPWTASAWPSLYTGMNPGKHGVFDFLRFDGYDWEVVNASHVRERTLWEVLDHHGYASVVVNAPVTYPVTPFDGALVPGYMAPENPTCHPAGILDDVEAAIGEYRVYPRQPDGNSSSPDVERYVEAIRSRGAAFRYLADRFEPDFGFVQFQVTDTVFHERPDEPALVDAIYSAVDDELERLLDAHEPANVVVVSDHGMGPYEGYEFRVNEFLSHHGFVASTRGGRGMPDWSNVRETRLKRGDERGDRDAGILERGMATVGKVGLTGQRVHAALDAAGLADVVLRHAPASLVRAARASTEQVDFPRSRAYVRSRTELGVRLNLAGREPNGVVPPAAYDAVCEEVISLLSEVTTPDGDPVFESVERREAYFDGPAAADAVDIVTIPANFEQFLSAQLAGSTFDEPSEPWNHKRDGVFAATGDAIDASASLADAHLFDVAPTVLATFGIAPDERMDGTPLPIVERFDERRYPEPDRREEVSIDGAAVEARLADLGYLE